MLKHKYLPVLCLTLLYIFTACTTPFSSIANESSPASSQSGSGTSQPTAAKDNLSSIEITTYNADFMEYHYNKENNRSGVNFFSLREIPELTDENSGQAYIDHTQNILYINFMIAVSSNTGTPTGPQISYEVDLSTNTVANVITEDYEGDTQSNLSGKFPQISDAQLLRIAGWFQDVIITLDETNS